MDTQRKVMRRKKGKEEEKEERRNIRKKYSSHTHTQAKVGLMCQGYGSVQKMSRDGGRSNDDFSEEASVHI